MQEIPTLTQQLVQLWELGLMTGIIPLLAFAAIYHTIDYWRNKK